MAALSAPVGAAPALLAPALLAPALLAPALLAPALLAPLPQLLTALQQSAPLPVAIPPRRWWVVMMVQPAARSLPSQVPEVSACAVMRVLVAEEVSPQLHWEAPKSAAAVLQDEALARCASAWTRRNPLRAPGWPGSQTLDEFTARRP